MKNLYLTKENKKYYQQDFLLWMDKNYPFIKRPDIMASNIMYSINRDIGFSINDLLYNHLEMDEYVEKYTKYFESIKRKSPRGHAHVQKWCATYFLEYFNSIKHNHNK
ncbi:MAG: hypothetical protein RBT45_06815 [Acholeplasmataceae bacterium]|jgi:hypothetical protein|nr:hypothetical protein [Acholeplasmataceae bacterium]